MDFWISGYPMDVWIHDGILDSWIHEGFMDSRWILVLVPIFLLLGGLPPDPLLFLGGFQLPEPLAGDLQPPAPPRRFLRGSASQTLRFLGVPRSWYLDLGTKMEPK